MKTNIKNRLKKTLPLLLIFFCFIMGTSAKITLQKPDFSGTWVLNVSKSDFGDIPKYVAPKQVKITSDKENLIMEMLVIAVSGADSTMIAKLPTTGNTVHMLTADQRTRLYNATWTDNDQILKAEYSSSYSGKPDEEEYHTIEIWKLSSDGKQLLLNKQVKVANGYEYAVKVVYDKQ